MFELSDLHEKLDRILSEFNWRGIHPPELKFGTLFEELKEIAEDVSCGFEPYTTKAILDYLETKKNWNYCDYSFMIIFLADEGLVPQYLAEPHIERLEHYIASPNFEYTPWSGDRKTYKGSLHRSK